MTIEELKRKTRKRFTELNGLIETIRDITLRVVKRNALEEDRLKFENEITSTNEPDKLLNYLQGVDAELNIHEKVVRGIINIGIVIDKVSSPLLEEFELLEEEYKDWQDQQPSSFVEAGEVTEPLINQNYNTRRGVLRKLMIELNKYDETVFRHLNRHPQLNLNEVKAEVTKDCNDLIWELNEYIKSKPHLKL